MRALQFGFALALLTWLSPRAAHAYIGPGAGLTAIGALLSLIGALLLALVGFVWYPIRRLLRARKSAQAPSSATLDDSDESDPSR